MRSSNDLPMPWVEKIFMRLHGRFGNQFFDKFRTGMLTDEGKDMGIENAKLVWSQDLAGITPERITQALLASYAYPPSCDDFKNNCVAKLELGDFKKLSAPIDREANRDNAEKIAQLAANICRPETDSKKWARRILDAAERGERVNGYALKCAQEVLGSRAHAHVSGDVH